MRLDEKEAKIIVNEARRVFGSKTHVYLFGSRVDDTKKGGDIDLFIETEKRDSLFADKILFLALVKSQIGDQRIDVIFAEDPERLIEQEARKWAIPLIY